MEQCGGIITGRAPPGFDASIGQARPHRRISRSRQCLDALVVLLACPIAQPLHAQTAPPVLEDRAQALECLSLAIAYEAGYESVEGQQAVAEVVLNRVRAPGFPKSVCGVVFAGSQQRTGCQFTFTCDGSLRRRLPDRVQQQARQIAEQVLDGRRPALVGGALNYHASYVSPYWAPTLQRVARIGLHIFYTRPGGGGATTAPLLPPAAISSAPAPIFAPWGLRPGPAPDPR